MSLCCSCVIAVRRRGRDVVSVVAEGYESEGE